jgi:elongator complex protein 1
LLSACGRLVRVVAQQQGDNHKSGIKIIWDIDLQSILKQQEQDDDNKTDDYVPPHTWFSVTLVNEGTAVVCLSHQGAIVTVPVTITSSQVASLVGIFEHGLLAGSWSPDRQLLVLATWANVENDNSNETSTGLCLRLPTTAVLVCLTATEYAVWAEINLGQVASNTDVHMVWRPDGSQLAVSSVDATDNNLRKLQLFRRSDNDGGLLLTALGRTEDGSGKLIANLQATPLGWAGPACSQVLATVVTKGHQDLVIALVEPNGLRHGGFALGITKEVVPTTTIQNLEWNTMSDILMVHLRYGSTGDAVQLWTRSNYHWYLKWEHRYSQHCSRILWDEEDPYRLDVLGTSGEWHEYTFQWATSHVAKDLYHTAFVVDGAKLLLTPLEKALVPPPMAAATIQFAASVTELVVSYCTHGTDNPDTSVLCGAVLANQQLVLLGGVDTSTTSFIGNYAPPTIQVSVSLPTQAQNWRLFTFVKAPVPGQVEFIVVEASQHYGMDMLHHVVVSWSTVNSTNSIEESNASVHLAASLPLKCPCLAICPWVDDSQGALLELQNGELLEFDSNDGILTPLFETSVLLEPCPWISALKHPNQSQYLEKDNNDEGGMLGNARLVFGMSQRGRLFCHDFLLSDSISSFQLDPIHGFLAYVTSTSQCELRFIPLPNLINMDPLGGLDETVPLLTGYKPRHVERGTRLVTTLTKPSAILQMPRGNLEGIFPRALVLQRCMKLIFTKQFAESFTLMRRQKIDTNLIVDMDPHFFLYEGCLELVEQLKEIDYLNLFISTLQNWNSTEQRYPVPEWMDKRLNRDGTISKDFDFASKVNQVCQRLRAILIEAEQEGRTKGGRTVELGHFLLPILSTFAKEDPPQLEQALRLIQSNAILACGTSTKKSLLFSDTAQKAIHYLAFLADYELLFNTALGMYEYDIARAVARNSQMDPKFYLPLLKQQQEFPQFYGRYKVDLRLKRYENALRNLFQSQQSGEDLTQVLDEESKGNGFDACFDLIREHQLHDVGLQLHSTLEEKYHILMDLGDSLLNAKKVREALTIFQCAIPIDNDRIMRAARACQNWRVYFTHAFPEGNVAGKDLDDVELSRRQLLARDIAEEIESSYQQGPEKRRVTFEAARVLLDYGRNIYEAIETLLRGQLWDEAVRTAIMYARPDLRRKCLDAAVAYAVASIEDCRERMQTFVESMRRYEEVLQIRKNAYAAGEVDTLGMGDGTQDNETGSLFSAASQASNLSNLSRGSTGSTGSVGSISTVISVKSTTSFSLVGTDESFRHKSKYNDIGKKTKKKQRKKKNSNRVIPGSEQELQKLVETLQVGIPDEFYVQILSETILFLCGERQLDVARDLYMTLIETSTGIQSCLKEYQKQEISRAKVFAREQPGRELVTHPSEKTVNACKVTMPPTVVSETIRHLEFV